MLGNPILFDLWACQGPAGSRLRGTDDGQRRYRGGKVVTIVVIYLLLRLLGVV
jgi:hypothetical protein